MRIATNFHRFRLESVIKHTHHVGFDTGKDTNPDEKEGEKSMGPYAMLSTSGGDITNETIRANVAVDKKRQSINQL